MHNTRRAHAQQACKRTGECTHQAHPHHQAHPSSAPGPDRSASDHQAHHPSSALVGIKRDARSDGRDLPPQCRREAPADPAGPAAGLPAGRGPQRTGRAGGAAASARKEPTSSNGDFFAQIRLRTRFGFRQVCKFRAATRRDSVARASLCSIAIVGKHPRLSPPSREWRVVTQRPSPVAPPQSAWRTCKPCCPARKLAPRWSVVIPFISHGPGAAEHPCSRAPAARPWGGPAFPLRPFPLRER